MTEFQQLLRENIRKLVPYSSARSEYKGDAAIFLDANENPYNEPVNRYPDPLQVKLKEQISQVKNIRSDGIFLGNGSDEAIDLIIRAFCEPRQDNIVASEPTYGMYKVCADINDVEYRKVLLNSSFEPEVESLLNHTDDKTKIIFLCSPNNPTSNSYPEESILRIVKSFRGIVVLDEAYIDFSAGKGFLSLLAGLPNLIILQTFSKAWGMAGIRLGMAFADPGIIAVLNRIKYPYNINTLTLETAITSLKERKAKEKWVKIILEQREMLERAMKIFPFVLQIYPSDANFLLVKVDKPREIYHFLASRGIIVRDRSGASLCEGCLRITIGNPEENMRLKEALKTYQANHS